MKRKFAVPAGLLAVQKRLSQGLTILASYTKAKLISDSVAFAINFGSIEQVTNNTYQDGAYDRRLECAIDPTDVSQRFVISAVYRFSVQRSKSARQTSSWRMASADDRNFTEGPADRDQRREQQLGEPP